MSGGELLYILLDSGVLWPCSVRFSVRARRTKLSVLPEGRTELVLPTVAPHIHFNKEELQTLLLQWQPWLSKTCNKLFTPTQQRDIAQKIILRHSGTFQAHEILPSRIDLPLVNECWQVQHSTLQSEKYAASLEYCGPMHLSVRGAVYECCVLLQRWLKARAHPIFEQQLRSLASQLRLHVNRVRIASQRGRWGSCSSQKNINLNCRLLLLPPHLVQHVMYHELCHLTHMNHSPAYRALLGTVSPQWKEHEKSLDVAWKDLPEWVTIRRT